MTTLAQQLRHQCAEAHAGIEQHPFIQKLFSGGCDRPAYGRYLARLAPVYAALETGLAALPPESPYRALCLPVLYRSSAVAADLQVLDQSPLAIEVVPLAAYLAEANQPQRLAAGFYVRYLGDLGGGQILARVLKRSLELPDERGLAFFCYPEITVEAGRQQAKNALDTVGQRLPHAPIIHAAQKIFDLHETLFAQG